MWLWLMAFMGGFRTRGDRARACAGAMIDPSPLSPCDGLMLRALRRKAGLRGRIMRTLEALPFRLSGTTGRGPILSAVEGDGGGVGLRGRGASLMRMRGMVPAQFGYFYQGEMARFGRGDAKGAVVAASCKGPGAKPCEVLGPGPWARWDHSAQSGLRFSRKAVMPSSVSRQSMFSTIVAPVRA